jgi:Alpha/beta hydrolase domain
VRAAKSFRIASIVLVGLLLGLAASAHARITRVVVDKVESPIFGGAEFGKTGQYEKVTGRAYGELDPKDELNRGIVLIDKAPLNAAGWVEYSVDFAILKPVDMSRGNRTIFYDVVNRGDWRAFATMHVGGNPGNNPVGEKDGGDGFLMKLGYTIVVSGWQGDVTPGDNRMTGQFPLASEAGGKPITRMVTAEYIVTKPTYTLHLGDEGGRTPARAHPAVPERVGEARLMRRSGPLAPREPIANSEWSFGNCPDGKDAKPSNLHICYPAGFTTDYAYELVYVAQEPLVMGVSFAATRDLISFLRRERSAGNPLFARGESNPGADPMRFAIGFGRSQSGRYIKDLVNQGFNLDEQRRIVFDGILPLISGSRITNTNMEFATPGRVPSTVTQHYYAGDQFPFTYATVKDPVTGRTDGWLMRCSAQKACPKVFHMDSSTEAWGARNSLVITDAAGRRDLPVPDNVRLYYFSATQHGPVSKPSQPGLCKNLNNPNPYREGVRALVVAMQDWIADGRTPPPSRFPRVSDGTLTQPSSFGFPAIPGSPFFDKLGDHHVKDFGVQPPVKVMDKRYVVLVPKVDADGNEIGGIHSTMREVPLGTYTGWNLRKAGMMENEFCDLQGSYLPFAKTAADRGADPRPSLQERYGSKAEYVAKVEKAAARLVSERFLLPEDAARLVAEARARELGF